MLGAVASSARHACTSLLVVGERLGKGWDVTRLGPGRPHVTVRPRRSQKPMIILQTFAINR